MPSSTQISTPAYTLTPDVPSATFTAAPTWTLLATLPIEEAENAVAELFLNNGNCQLPCWWGIVPGETTWREAHAMLSPLVLGDIYYGQILSDGMYVEFILPVSEGLSDWEGVKQVDVIFFIQDFKVKSIDLFDYGLASVLEFPKFLKVLGTPEQIWILTFVAERDGGVPFDIVFFYPEQAVIALYQFGEGVEVANNAARMCSKIGRYPFIGLWDQELELNFSEAFQLFFDSGFQIEEYIKLEDATGVNIETFIERLKDQDPEFCLETPLDLWHPFR